MTAKRNWFRFLGGLILFLSLFLITVSCGKDIRDFFKAIDKYGYKSKEPLGKNNVVIDKQLLGGYVYNSLPVIISQKDNFTYKMTFLTVELDEENVDVDAFITEINNSRYLNINMGDVYCFLKISTVINNELAINLLRNTLETYVKPENLKAWLIKHGNDESYTPENQSEVDIYYSFVFNKITVEKAYEIQQEELHTKKVELFESCKDYYAYEQLEKRYPNDPMLHKARENLLNKCKTIDNYQAFIKRFPDDFMFELTEIEFTNLRSQFGTSSWGGVRYLPMAFTEQGVAMLSSVLSSERAVMVNIQIIRIFTKMRELLSTHKEILQKLEQLEKNDIKQDEKIILIFEYLKQLEKARQEEIEFKNRPRLGFKSSNGK